MLRAITEFASGMLICWFLNVVQLGVAFVLLASTEKALPSVYVLAAALGLVQFGYVLPIYRLLWRKQRRYSAHGLLTAAFATALANAVIDYHLFGSAMFHFWR